MTGRSDVSGKMKIFQIFCKNSEFEIYVKEEGVVIVLCSTESFLVGGTPRSSENNRTFFKTLFAGDDYKYSGLLGFDAGMRTNIKKLYYYEKQRLHHPRNIHNC